MIDGSSLHIRVGCEFGLETSRAVDAVMQVAPALEQNVQLQHEAWHTDVRHHGFIDDHSNRCERMTLPAGGPRVVYEARLRLPHPADVLDAEAPETAVGDL